MARRYTHVKLLANVPFDNTYQHTRWCKTQQEQETYFNSFPVLNENTDCSYQRDTQLGGVFRVDRHKDALYACNYLIFKNEETYPSKWQYAFVTDIEYKNDNTSFVTFEIDVLQTYRFDIGIRESFIAKEHPQLYYSNGIPFINTIEEGLDYGREYTTTNVTQFHPSDGVNFLVILTSEAMPLGEKEDKSGGSIVGGPSPFSYYILPINSNGEVYKPNGAGNADFGEYMAFLTTKEPFLNKIVGMYLTSYTGLPFKIDHANKTVRLNSGGSFKITLPTYASDPTGKMKTFAFFGIKEAKTFVPKKLDLVGNVYHYFKETYPFSVKESKLFMYPYCLIEITDTKGHVMTIRPEYLTGGKLSVFVKGSLGISNKVMLEPIDYDVSNSQIIINLSDKMLIDNDPNDVGVKTDYASAFMQGNKNSLIAQEQNIRNTFRHGMGNSAMSAGGAIFSALASNNPFVGLTNIMGSGQQVNNYIAEKENGLNLLSGKIADIENVPDNVTQLGSNLSFTMGNFQNYYQLRFKQIKYEYATRLDRYFSMYGTKSNRVATPNLQTRKAWNFIKLKEPNIVGTMSNDVLQRVKQIFSAGVTLWHTNDILNYNQDNGDV